MAPRGTKAEELFSPEVQRLFRSRGISISPSGLIELVVSVVEKFPVVEGEETELSEDDRDALREVGLTFEEFEEDEEPLLSTAVRYSEIVASSLSTTEAANRLGVKPSRIRQRLNAEKPTMYGFKHERRWHLPRFQFGRDGLLPEITDAIRAVPDDWSPVEVYNWFMKPNPDLVDGDEPLSPVEWLEKGRGSDPLVEILTHIR